MSFKQGKIEKLIVKEEREGQFGLSAPYAIVIEGEYYNGWASEDNVTHTCIPKASKASDYAELKEGMNIEFMYETNAKGYHDIDKKTIKVIGAVQTSQKPVDIQSTPRGTNQPASMDMAYIKARCMDMALKYSGRDFNSENYADIKSAANALLKYCLS